MSFKFGFGETPEKAPVYNVDTKPSKLHTLSLLSKDAPRISYSGLDVDKTPSVRRDLFDARYQLMQQDELNEEERILLGEEDVRKSVYEGGLKVWEGTTDLLEALSIRPPNFDVLELGAGAGLPSAYLLYLAIRANKPGKFVLADYNESVLRLLTMPNVVLAWLAATDQLESLTRGEVNLTSEVVEKCEQDLAQRDITVQFISGGWSTEFSALVGGTAGLVLASETIYAPESLPAFTQVVDSALGPNSTALVAAKRAYFGVGGGVVEFEKLLNARNLKHEVISKKGNVGRVILSVTRSA